MMRNDSENGSVGIYLLVAVACFIAIVILVALLIIHFVPLQPSYVGMDVRAFV